MGLGRETPREAAGLLCHGVRARHPRVSKERGLSHRGPYTSSCAYPSIVSVPCPLPKSPDCEQLALEPRAHHFSRNVIIYVIGPIRLALQFPGRHNRVTRRVGIAAQPGKVGHFRKTVSRCSGADETGSSIDYLLFCRLFSPMISETFPVAMSKLHSECTVRTGLVVL